MSKILLLVSGFPKVKSSVRNRIGRELEKLGHDVVIMEYPHQKDVPLHLRFYDITKQKFDVVVALHIHDKKYEAVNDAVNFELGFLTHRHIRSNSLSKLYVLTDIKTDAIKLASYLREGLFYAVVRDPFATEKDIITKVNRFSKTRQANSAAFVFGDSLG